MLVSPPEPENLPSCGFPFQSGDIVRRFDGRGGPMTVILALGDQVTCEWLLGTERQQRAFPSRLFRLVFRAVRSRGAYGIR
jgi:hypothetical protein